MIKLSVLDIITQNAVFKIVKARASTLVKQRSELDGVVVIRDHSKTLWVVTFDCARVVTEKSIIRFQKITKALSVRRCISVRTTELKYLARKIL